MCPFMFWKDCVKTEADAQALGAVRCQKPGCLPLHCKRLYTYLHVGMVHRPVHTHTAPVQAHACTHSVYPMLHPCPWILLGAWFLPPLPPPLKEKKILKSQIRTPHTHHWEKSMSHFHI